MSLPANIDAAKPAGTDQVSAGDDDIRALKQFIVDILGLPTAPTNMTAALMDANADGTIASSLSIALKAVANVFTATQKWAKGADIVSAATLTPGADGNYFDVTGTVTVTAIATVGVGTVIRLHFDAALTLTHNAVSLVLPSGANITTAAGDEFTFVEESAGNWRMVSANRPIDSKGADIVSAATLPVLAPGYFDVTGTTTITAIADIGIGSVVTLHFDGALTLTHNATDLILPNGNNIVTGPGDEYTFIQYAIGDWRMISGSVAKLGRMQRAEEFGANSGAVTVLSAFTTLVDLPSITVNVGDRVIVDAWARFQKGVTGGESFVGVLNNGGTATVTFLSNLGEAMIQRDQAASTTESFPISMTGRVAVAGTFIPRLRGRSLGSNSTVSALDGEVYVSVLNNG